MAVNPSGLPNKYKWVDRFMENQIRFTKTLIPDGQLPESTMARIGKSLHCFRKCLKFSEHTFGVPDSVCTLLQLLLLLLLLLLLFFGFGIGLEFDCGFGFGIGFRFQFRFRFCYWNGVGFGIGLWNGNSASVSIVIIITATTIFKSYH
jgi:hypothetical protein